MQGRQSAAAHLPWLWQSAAAHLPWLWQSAAAHLPWLWPARDDTKGLWPARDDTTEIIWKTHGHINPMVSNPTHDLRLLNIVSAKIPLKGASLPPSEMNGFVDHSMSPPYNPTTQKQINTVTDVITWLTTAVSDKWTQEKSSYSDSSYKVYGHMTIDSEAETFTYEPVTD